MYTSALDTGPNPENISLEDIRALRRDKYQGNPDADMSEDLARLAAGEPLAYVIGWIPFLGLTIHLDSHPLIPRPETEWWTEKLIEELRQKFDDKPFSFLDLCAGSGCIGLAVLKTFPNAYVSFAELMPEHCALIHKNIEVNNLNASRATIYQSDLFAALDTQCFDVIAANPPYIPSGRILDPSVTDFEPPEALFSGLDGLDVIRTIVKRAPSHLKLGGTLWMECDIDNADKARDLLTAAGMTAELHNDQYGRPRFLVAY